MVGTVWSRTANAFLVVFALVWKAFSWLNLVPSIKFAKVSSKMTVMSARSR
jgi:hypothetical protein